MGAISAYYAKARGRNPWAWFFIGLLLGVFGITLLFILPRAKKKLVEAAEVPPPAVAQPVPSPHANKLWYYLDEQNNQFGPMSWNALQEAKKDGKISSNTYVWNEELPDWQLLEGFTS